MGMVEPSKAEKPARFDIFLINLNPTKGSEIKKTRPCVIISPNEINFHLSTVIVAPMTTKMRKYPTRIALNFDSKEGQIALDQLRTVDQSRLIQKLGWIEKKTQKYVLGALLEMFRE
jgi:mRNA interferase MazF